MAHGGVGKDDLDLLVPGAKRVPTHTMMTTTGWLGKKGAWRRVAARVPCGDRCKWMLANFAGIGWEGALRRIAVEYKQKCGALARPECATVLADERKKIRIGAGVGSSGK